MPTNDSGRLTAGTLCREVLPSLDVLPMILAATGVYKLVRMASSEPWQLYDLGEDLSETNGVAV